METKEEKKLVREKRGHFMYRLFCPKGIFFLNLCFTSINSVLNTLSVYKYFYVQEKKLLFPEMRVTRKIFTRVAVIFFSQFSGGSLFPSLVSFVYFSFFFLFFWFLCFLFVLLLFFEIKNAYSDTHLIMWAGEW